jgi:hypothetical protein
MYVVGITTLCTSVPTAVFLARADLTVMPAIDWSLLLAAFSAGMHVIGFLAAVLWTAANRCVVVCGALAYPATLPSS